MQKLHFNNGEFHVDFSHRLNCNGCGIILYYCLPIVVSRIFVILVHLNALIRIPFSFHFGQLSNKVHV